MRQFTYDFDELPVHLSVGDGDLTVLLTGTAEIDYCPISGAWGVEETTVQDWTDGKYTERAFKAYRGMRGYLCKRIEEALNANALSSVRDAIADFEEGYQTRRFDRGAA